MDCCVKGHISNVPSPQKCGDNPDNERFSAMAVSRVSVGVVVMALVASSLVSFVLGRAGSIFLFYSAQSAVVQTLGMWEHNTSNKHDVPHKSRRSEDVIFRKTFDLPVPTLPRGKVISPTLYTSKHFDTAKSVANSRWLAYDGTGQDTDPADIVCPVVQTEHTNNPQHGQHLPKGQHLLMDIEYVDSEFLNSEERLSNAMLDLVQLSGLTLLSYHCHGLTPSGVSCAGVLLESHVAFHTWPKEGVITLDLFTCGDESLLPTVPIAENLFGIPRQDGTGQTPHSVWAHKMRGFDDLDDGDDDDKNTINGGESETTDFYDFPIGRMSDFKHKVLSAQTAFQRVDIYDVLIPNVQSFEDFTKSLQNDGSYQANHPELFRPDRIVFLDGVMQSRRSGDAAYHEALVHPSMFAHANPKRVAIIGGGEGATLREVLKHKTVEKVVMIDIDEQMVSLSREYLPEWSDCRMLEGISGSCFEDPRVELYCEDAFAWFIDRYSDASEDPFDVIIMDALDPQIQVDFVVALYDDGPFLKSLPNALSWDGILIAQVGEASYIDSPAESLSMNRNRANFLRSLGDLGFEAVRSYEEIRGGFGSPWQFVIAFKAFESQVNWFDASAVVNLKIRQRVIPTMDGRSPLLFFDGPAMESYYFPSRASEEVFCRDAIDAAGCALGHGFDPNKINLPLSALEVVPQHEGDQRIRSIVLATRNIPQLSYIGLEDLIHMVHLPRKSRQINTLLNSRVPSLFGDDDVVVKPIDNVLGIYAASRLGDESGKRGHVNDLFPCFVNFQFRSSSDFFRQRNNATERNDDDVDAGVLGRYNFDRHLFPIYNPAAARQSNAFFASAVPLRDIVKGEEIDDDSLRRPARCGHLVERAEPYSRLRLD